MAEEKGKESIKKFVVVLVRGLVGVNHKIKETLKMLNLTRTNQAVVIEENKINLGMLIKVKDYVTWGDIDSETYEELITKRGSEWLGRTSDGKSKYNYNKFIEINGKKYNKVFRLNPPRKGFGRKGIKRPFNTGGALGRRGEAINDLIKRMI